MQIVQFDANYYARTPGIVVQWDTATGTHYQCGECYGKTLTATYPAGAGMSNPPRVAPPPGTRCYCGKQVA